MKTQVLAPPPSLQFSVWAGPESLHLCQVPGDTDLLVQHHSEKQGPILSFSQDRAREKRCLGKAPLLIPRLHPQTTFSSSCESYSSSHPPDSAPTCLQNTWVAVTLPTLSLPLPSLVTLESLSWAAWQKSHCPPAAMCHGLLHSLSSGEPSLQATRTPDTLRGRRK